MEEFIIIVLVFTFIYFVFRSMFKTSTNYYRNMIIALIIINSLWMFLNIPIIKERTVLAYLVKLIPAYITFVYLLLSYYFPKNNKEKSKQQEVDLRNKKITTIFGFKIIVTCFLLLSIVGAFLLLFLTNLKNNSLLFFIALIIFIVILIPFLIMLAKINDEKITVIKGDKDLKVYLRHIKKYEVSIKVSSFLPILSTKTQYLGSFKNINLNKQTNEIHHVFRLKTDEEYPLDKLNYYKTHYYYDLPNYLDALQGKKFSFAYKDDKIVDLFYE